MDKKPKPEPVVLSDIRRYDIELPDLSPPSLEEIARRRKIFAETLALRAKGKPPTPGNSLEDYLRLIREEDDPS